MSNFFGVGDEETVEKWKDRVERIHATSKLVGSGYKPREPGETPISAYPISSAHTAAAFPATAPAFRLTGRAPDVRDPFRFVFFYMKIIC